MFFSLVTFGAGVHHKVIRPLQWEAVCSGEQDMGTHRDGKRNGLEGFTLKNWFPYA